MLRRLGSRDPECMCRIAEAWGIWKEGDPVGEAHLRLADELQRVFDSLQMPRKLGPEALTAFLAVEAAKWGPLAKATGTG